jgi:hypothetical protein
LYWEEELGHQFIDRHNNQRGFGGSRFVLTMEDGRKVEIIGPWSSRPDVVRQHGDIGFIGCDEKLVDDGIILYQPGGGNNWCCLYDYTGKEALEYHFKEDNNKRMFDYGRSVNDY